MNSQILVPLDGSPTAETILPHVEALARMTASELTLLLVEPMIDPILVPGLLAAIPVPDAEHPTWPRPYIHSVAARLAARGLVVHTRVVPGPHVAGAILEFARDPLVSLIGMTTHGRSGLEHWIMGSVAERVLHAAPKPLLLLRTPARQGGSAPDIAYRTILVPLDGSPFAAQALGAVRILAATTGATVVLLGVIPRMDDLGLAEGGITPLWKLAECDTHERCLQHSLDAAAGMLQADGLTVRTTLLEGPPAESIVRGCALEGADLLIMATHGRSGLRRLVLGSVATGVVHRADVPILLTRPHEQHPGKPVGSDWYRRQAPAWSFDVRQERMVGERFVFDECTALRMAR